MKNCENQNRGKFNSMVDMRTLTALKQKHIEFAETMKEASDDELIRYLQNCARKLGYSPCMTEVIGGRYIASRFGGWFPAIAAAGLKKPGKAPDIRRRKIYKEEYKQQIHLIKMETHRRQEVRRQERELRAEAAQAVKEERLRRDMHWGKTHGHLSDEELLAYVKEKAAELGATPFAREVEGGEYIAERFCGWPMVLKLAELPLPQGMKPPKPAKQAEYNKKKKLKI